jgi:hypothetical protein
VCKSKCLHVGTSQNGKNTPTPPVFSQEWQAKDLQDTELGSVYGKPKVVMSEDLHVGMLRKERQNVPIGSGSPPQTCGGAPIRTSRPGRDLPPTSARLRSERPSVPIGSGSPLQTWGASIGTSKIGVGVHLRDRRCGRGVLARRPSWSGEFKGHGSARVNACQA